MKRFLPSLILTVPFFIGCPGGESSDDSAAALLLLGAGESVAPCQDIALENPSADNKWVLLSADSATIKHVRIEGAYANNAASKSATLYLLTGYEDGQAGMTTTPTASTAGDGKLIFRVYQNGHQPNGGFPYVNYNNETGYGTADGTGTGASLFSSFTSTASDICFDISSDATPRFTFWATGVNGADCKNWSTLTDATKVFSKNDWSASLGIGSTGKKSVYFKTNSGATASKVTACGRTAI